MLRGLAARSTRHDINILQHRFGVSFEQACHRLTTLQRPGREGIAFHLLRVDIAGNISESLRAMEQLVKAVEAFLANTLWNTIEAT